MSHLRRGEKKKKKYILVNYFIIMGFISSTTLNYKNVLMVVHTFSEDYLLIKRK